MQGLLADRPGLSSPRCFLSYFGGSPPPVLTAARQGVDTADKIKMATARAPIARALFLLRSWNPCLRSGEGMSTVIMT